jgi:putative endonuclease
MKSGYRQELGRTGELLAADFLEKQGHTILENNFRTPYGEIDLITKSGEIIVFVEVKTRASRSLGPPEIAITARKQEHMRSAAEHYMQQRPELHNDYRIDVITIQIQADNNPAVIDHFENVIT